MAATRDWQWPTWKGFVFPEHAREGKKLKDVYPDKEERAVLARRDYEQIVRGA